MEQVIPAKAGIQSMDAAFLKVREVDSRLHRNDRELGTPSLANASIPHFRGRLNASLLSLMVMPFLGGPTKCQKTLR
jgi:hypothetical protein